MSAITTSTLWRSSDTLTDFIGKYKKYCTEDKEIEEVYEKIYKHLIAIDENERIEKADKAVLKMDYLKVLMLDGNDKELEDIYLRLQKADPIYFTQQSLTKLRSTFRQVDNKSYIAFQSDIRDIVKDVAIKTSPNLDCFFEDLKYLEDEFNSQINEQRLKYGLEPIKMSDYLILKALRNCTVHNDLQRKVEKKKGRQIDYNSYLIELNEKKIDKIFEYNFDIFSNLMHNVFELMNGYRKFPMIGVMKTKNGFNIISNDDNELNLDFYQKRYLRNEARNYPELEIEELLPSLPLKDNSMMLMTHMKAIRDAIVDFNVNNANRNFYDLVIGRVPMIEQLGEQYLDVLMSTSALFYIMVNIDKHPILDRLAEQENLSEEDKSNMNKVAKKLRNAIVHGRLFYDQYENSENGGTIVLYDFEQEDDDFDDVSLHSNYNLQNKNTSNKIVAIAEISYKTFSKLPYLFADCLDDRNKQSKIVSDLLEEYKNFNQNPLDLTSSDAPVRGI